MAKYDSDEFDLDSDLLNDDDITLQNIPTSELEPSEKPSVNNSLYNLISSHGPELAELLMKEFGKSRIHLRHLASLTDEDLALLGVESPDVRRAMLKEFSQLPNQVDHYDQVIANTDASKYNDQVLNNIWAHMTNLKTAMSIALLELHIKPMENNLLNQRTYTSTLVLKILDEIEKYSSAIEEELQVLQNQQGEVTKNQPIVPKDENFDEVLQKSRKSTFKTFLFVSMLTIGAGVLLCRYGKSGFNIKRVFE